MKNTVLLILAIATAAMLVACALPIDSNQTELWEKDMFSRLYDTDSQQADSHVEQILKAIEDQNTKDMANLFSSTVRESVFDLDLQIEELFSFCDGSVVFFDRIASGSSGEKVEGKYYKEIEATYDFSTTMGDYRMALLICTIDSECPENVGIQSIFITKAEDSDKTYAYWGDDEWIPGINIRE